MKKWLYFFYYQLLFFVKYIFVKLRIVFVDIRCKIGSLIIVSDLYQKKSKEKVQELEDINIKIEKLKKEFE
jgi:hypothetical protein